MLNNVKTLKLQTATAISDFVFKFKVVFLLDTDPTETLKERLQKLLIRLSES